MSRLNLKELVGKLNDTCRNALEGAAGLCLSRTNYNVEVEHWLLKLLEQSKSDLPLILRQYGVDQSRLTADLTKRIDRFKTGNSRPPALSETVIDAIREAWLLASVDFSETRLRSGHLLCALLNVNTLSDGIHMASREFEKVSAEGLLKDLYTLVRSSDEAAQSSAPTPAGKESPGGGPAKPTRTPALDQFTTNLTERARSGKIDPVLGRDPEIRQIIDILLRRRQNNPILTGEAGVGKTAVAEGFALRIVSGDVPEALRNVGLHTLDLGLLQAGAGVKGEFENRLKSVIEEVKKSPTPIILFIDEAHTLIGAGGQSGQGDAANLLKPALARGELRTIAATTWAEYKKYFERDAALARRFQVVKVEEPDETAAIDMMSGLLATLESHHGVTILQEAVTDAVRLSKRYISGRQLPDKSVSILDTTCARIAISQTTKPPTVEDCERRLERLATVKAALQREVATGADHAQRISELEQEQTNAEAELKALRERWENERQLVTKIRQCRDRLTAKPEGKEGQPPPQPLTDAEREATRGELREAEGQLKKMQGESPLVHVCVDSQAVAETISSWTGIPLGRMVSDEVQTVLNLRRHMEESIIGQSHALDAISQRIQTSRAKLGDPRTPIGVFLLAGTSGVGKTETAITLANLLYGGEQNMTVINMSEFKEEHKVSLLMGSPPGYVGYGEGGILTEAVRRKPYSVVLLDEMEKAHPGVQDIFYQVFDKGSLRDGEGRDIDFKNTLILMTSNAGTDLIKSLCADPETAPDAEGLSKALFPELLKTFKPAFLGRLSVVPYFPLSEEVMAKIVELKLKKIGKRIRENYQAAFHYSPEFVKHVVARCTEVDTGARNVDHILNGSLLPQMATEVLSRMAAGRAIAQVDIGVGEDGGFKITLD